MAAVQQAACVAYHLHAREVRLTERSTIALRAVEEMAREIERAGLGLGGDVVAILPGAPGSSADSDGITIRSSPDALMAVLQSDVRPGQDRALVAGASLFQPGERVFLTDTTGPPIPAVVVDADSRTLTLRDMAPPTGPPRRSILADRAGRVRRFREVSYFPRDLPGESRPALVRTIDAGPETILARGVEQLRFEYRDDAGRRLNPMRLPRGGPRFVRVRLGLGELRDCPPSGVGQPARPWRLHRLRRAAGPAPSPGDAGPGPRGRRRGLADLGGDGLGAVPGQHQRRLARGLVRARAQRPRPARRLGPRPARRPAAAGAAAPGLRPGLPRLPLARRREREGSRGLAPATRSRGGDLAALATGSGAARLRGARGGGSGGRLRGTHPVRRGAPLQQRSARPSRSTPGSRS
jgi:hypothetical protein